MERKYEFTSSGLVKVDKQIIDNVERFRRKNTLHKVDSLIMYKDPYLSAYINLVSECSKDLELQEYEYVAYPDPVARDLAYYVYLALSDCFNIELPEVSKDLVESVYYNQVYEDELSEENDVLFNRLNSCARRSMFLRNKVQNNLALDLSIQSYYLIKTQKINNDFSKAVSFK